MVGVKILAWVEIWFEIFCSTCAP